MKIKVEHNLSYEDARDLIVGTALSDDNLSHDVVHMLQQAHDPFWKKEEPDEQLRLTGDRFKDSLVRLLGQVERIVPLFLKPTPRHKSLGDIFDLTILLRLYIAYRLAIIPMTDIPDRQWHMLENGGINVWDNTVMQPVISLDSDLMSIRHARASTISLFDKHIQSGFTAASVETADQVINFLDGMHITPSALDEMVRNEVRFGYHYQAIINAQKQGCEYVEFIVQKNACTDCKRIYLLPDGSTRKFRIDPLLGMVRRTGGFNKGPHKDWVALPILHPWCRCFPIGVKG